jgi:inner membrane protein
MEVVADLNLHPLQYMLVGLANTLFYLLLLSLAEHVGFDAAYVLSAGASTALIAGYSAAILLRRTRALLMVGVLAALYALLYMTLKAQSFALLAGSAGLWVALAVVMYLTRRINWYADGDNTQKQVGEG